MKSLSQYMYESLSHTSEIDLLDIRKHTSNKSCAIISWDDGTTADIEELIKPFVKKPIEITSSGTSWYIYFDNSDRKNIEDAIKDMQTKY